MLSPGFNLELCLSGFIYMYTSRQFKVCKVLFGNTITNRCSDYQTIFQNGPQSYSASFQPRGQISPFNEPQIPVGLLYPIVNNLQCFGRLS